PTLIARTSYASVMAAPTVNTPSWASATSGGTLATMIADRNSWPSSTFRVPVTPSTDAVTLPVVFGGTEALSWLPTCTSITSASKTFPPGSPNPSKTWTATANEPSSVY